MQFIRWHAFSALKYMLQNMKGKTLIYSLLTSWAVKKIIINTNDNSLPYAEKKTVQWKEVYKTLMAFIL